MGAVLIVVAALAACGGDDDSAVPTPSSIRSEIAVAAPVPTSTAPPSTVASTTLGASSPTDSAPCRTVEHALGTACVPADPQRIVALDPLTVLPTLVAVDAPVIATVSVYASGDPFVDYLDSAETADLELVGSFDAAPNLERIAAVEPDLIIGSVSNLADVYDQMSAIAPTVATNYAFYEANWRDEVRLAADAAGRSGEATQLLADLQRRIDEVRATLAPDGVGPSLSRVDVYQGTPLYYRFGCVWFGELLQSVGVTQPPAQVAECDPGDASSAIGYLSLETLDVLEADAIVAYQQQANPDDVGADPLAALSASPLWEGLSVVSSGDVHVVGDAWGLGGSVQAAEQILDELVTTVFAR